MPELYNKYRPKKFDEVIGQAHVIKALRGIIKDRRGHAFLFTGPSGVGKTTLARIVARRLGCEPRNIQEHKAAVNTGVEEMRKVLETLMYRPFGESPYRAIILDECHRLSKQAWESLLLDIEEPPKNSFWLLCTTDPSRILKTIKTRCYSFALKSVSNGDLEAIMKRVMKAEGIKLNSEVTDVVIEQAFGSPRQLITNLDQCRECSTMQEATELLEAAATDENVIKLCRLLTSNPSWSAAMALVAKIEPNKSEEARIIINRYFAAAARNPKAPKKMTERFLSILGCFEKAYLPQDGHSPLLLSLGEIIL